MGRDGNGVGGGRVWLMGDNGVDGGGVVGGCNHSLLIKYNVK